RRCADGPSSARRWVFPIGGSRFTRSARAKSFNSGVRSGSFIADHLEFDPVLVEEVEPPAGFVVVVPPWLEPLLAHDPLGGVQVVDQEPKIGRASCRERVEGPAGAR